MKDMYDDNLYDSARKPHSAEWYRTQINHAVKTKKDWYEFCKIIDEEWHASNEIEISPTSGALQEQKSHIFWANTQLEAPALYSRIPEVISKVLWGQDNNAATVASRLLENTTRFYTEERSSYDKALSNCVAEAQISAQAVARIRMQETKGKIKVRRDVILAEALGFVHLDGSPVPEDVKLEGDNGEYYYYAEEKQTVNRDLLFEFVPREHFHCTLTDDWNKVWWVAFDYFLPKHEIEKLYKKEVADKALYDFDPNGKKINKDVAGAPDVRALVREVWCKVSKKVIILVSGYEENVKVIDDPYGLKEFFPCAEPMFFNKPDCKGIPTPLYTYYRPHVRSLDKLMMQRYELCEALEVSGICDETFTETLNNIKRLGNLKLYPVNMARYKEVGGLKGIMEIVFIPQIADTIQTLLNAEQSIKNTIYEISGLSDLVRGISDPNDTATAQQIKSNFATQRLGYRQAAVQKLAKELAILGAELICNHWDDDTITRIAGAQSFSPEEQMLIPQALMILRDQGLNQILIEIETDSTSAISDQLKKQSYVEFMSAIGQQIEVFTGKAQQTPALADLFFCFLSEGAKVYRFGRNVKVKLDKAIEDLKVQMSQPPAPPPVDPRVTIAQEQMKLDYEKMNQEIQFKYADLERKYQELATKNAQLVSQVQLKSEEFRQEMGIERMKRADREIDNTVKALSGMS